MSNPNLRTIKSVAIAGCGGIGSFACHYLFDQGFNRKQFPITEWKVDVFDDDVIEPSNLLHQNFGVDDLGKKKVDVISERTLGVINPIPRFMTEADFKDYDVVLCCVDSATFRKALYEHFWQKEKDTNPVFWIDGRCSSRNIGLFTSESEKAFLEKFVSNDIERQGCLLKFEKENKISHLTPSIVGAMAVQAFMNWLRKETTKERVTRV